MAVCRKYADTIIMVSVGNSSITCLAQKTIVGVVMRSIPERKAMRLLNIDSISLYQKTIATSEKNTTVSLATVGDGPKTKKKSASMRGKKGG
jgi:hypothetical protein